MAEQDEKKIEKERQQRRQQFVQKGEISGQGSKGSYTGKQQAKALVTTTGEHM